MVTFIERQADRHAGRQTRRQAGRQIDLRPKYSVYIFHIYIKGVNINENYRQTV